MSSDYFTHNSSGDDFSDMRRRDDLYSPSVAEVIRERVKRTCMNYVGMPMTYETMDAMRMEIIHLLKRYVSFGEIPDFNQDEVLVFTDPSDPNRLLIKVGKDGCHDPFCGTIPSTEG